MQNLKNNDFEISYKEDEIDFKKIFNFLIRNKKFLSLISLIFFSVGFIYSFFPKRTWEGQFQIVLNTDSGKDDRFSAISSTISKFTRSAATNSLNTEVGILKSPSVLMPAFEVVIQKKDNLTNNNYQFSEWRNNLSIDLERGTSILNISYRDKDKSVILPVLEKMSSTYQSYSGERKKKLNQFNQEYLESQIKSFNKKSAKSLQIAQDFAIDQDLLYFEIKSVKDKTISSRDNTPGIGAPKLSVNSSTFLPKNTNLERIRVEATNELKKVDMMLKKINELNNNQELKYVRSSMPELFPEGFASDLNDILRSVDEKIIEARSKYTEEDVTVKRLEEKKASTLQLLKEVTVNYLKSVKFDAQSKLEAALRPKGVLLKYKELVRNSQRDEETLIQLEEQLKIIELNKSRLEQPWELITKPTLLNNPIDKTKSNILIVSLLGGFLIGVIYKLYNENKSGRIFSINDLKQIFSQEFIEVISLKDIEFQENNIVYLNEFLNRKSNENINLIPIGDIEKENIKILLEFLKTNQKNKNKIELINSLSVLKKSAFIDTNILILEIGLVKFSEIETLNKYKELLNINLSGIIILNK